VKYMKLALKLAEKFRGRTSPNPLVGAVVVKHGKIIGKGAHQFVGGPHAEVYALAEAAENAKDATLYVTLEPCCHHGKTPPCTDNIIAAAISKVVVATLDPNPLVGGKGIQLLRDAGIEVEIGICEEEAKEQNEVFFHYIQTRKPFVIAKAAISLDGKIAISTGNSKWISNDKSRNKTHQLRNSVDAILIGKKTLLKDDPSLNVRLEKETEGPQKIVIIPMLDISVDQLTKMKIYKSSISKPLILVCHESVASKEKIQIFAKHRVEIMPVSGTQQNLDLDELLIKLGHREISSLLLEGGSGVYSSFMKAGLIKKMHIFQAPIFIGNDGVPLFGELGIDTLEDTFKMGNIRTEMLDDNTHWQMKFSYREECKCSQD
jgi:diaminohydroxyphosphoribosylaminopyrimidine deaminase / 5-amino-6-(5-phosphoribosylamino)uracil reductase